MKTILKNIFRHLCRTFFLLSVATGSAFGQSEALPAILLNESGLTLDSAARIAADKDIPFADKITMVRSITKSEQFNWHHEVQIKWIYTPLLEEAKQQKDNKMLADFYVSLSAWYVEWRWFKEAHAYLDSATVYLDDVTDPYILGNIHYIKGTEINFSKDTHSPEVIEQYNKAIDCLKQSKEYAGRASIRILYMTNHIAEYYSIINDTAKLKKYIDLLQPNSTNAQNLVYYRWLKAQSLINYYTILNDLTGNVNYRDSIIHHCWNSIRNADSLPEGMSWLKREITLDYLRIVVQTLEKDDLSNVNKLDSLIKEAEDIDEQKLFTTLTAMLETHHAKSLLAYKLNNLNEAEKFCRLGMEILAAQDDYNLPPSLRMQLVKPFFALATKIYEAKKDYAQALKYERLHNEIVREQTSLSRYEAIRNMEFSFELEKKETEKATIQKEAEQYRLVVGLQGGVIALVVIVFALLTVSLRNRRKRLAMELENTRLKAEESEHEKDQLIFRVVHSKFIPHFTGNVLNSINYLISRDPKRAQKYVADYAVFSARTLVNIDKVCQALHEEVEYVRVYLTLEKLRFEDRLEYTITIAPEVDADITVPVMILHTFCENAFKHGLRHKPGTWKLDIDVTATDGCTVIALTDNGVGRERAKALNTGGTGAGLKIVEQQIQLFNRQYGKHSFMKITDLYNEQKKPSGTRFELVIKN